MPDQNGFLPSLFDLESSQYGESVEEKAVKESIRAINEKKPIDASQTAIVQTCLSLAKSMSLGNAKGRAIANEATQLVTMLRLLAGEEETTAQSDLPHELQEIVRALATPPRPGIAPAGHDAA